MPPKLRNATLNDVLTGTRHAPTAALNVAETLSAFPAALLHAA